MKRKTILTTTALLFIASASCGKADGSQISYSAVENTSVNFAQEHSRELLSIQQSEMQKPEIQQKENAELTFRFADVSDWLFSFSSGAGAWSTELSINSDGTFEGLYHDADMGDSGESYPGGTLYICNFKGRFDHLEKVDEFTVKMKLVSLEFEQEPGKEELADDVKYIYSTAYGLDGGEEFYLYLPGAKLEQFPEEYRSWVGYYNLENTAETVLPFYGLYNINEGNGFSSYKNEKQTLSERIAEEISLAEKRGAELEAKLKEDVSQLDMNMTSAELFQTWDNTLNMIWKMLESELDTAKMESLRAEERKWITDKEEQIKAAGQEFAGASLQPMAEAMKAAELTRERVYELAKYAK